MYLRTGHTRSVDQKYRLSCLARLGLHGKNEDRQSRLKFFFSNWVSAAKLRNRINPGQCNYVEKPVSYNRNLFLRSFSTIYCVIENRNQLDILTQLVQLASHNQALRNTLEKRSLNKISFYIYIYTYKKTYSI